jgi:hypothetical protein
VLPRPFPGNANVKPINAQVGNLLRDFCKGSHLALARDLRFDVWRYRILVVLVLVLILISLNLLGGGSADAQTPTLNQMGPSHALTK